VPVLDLWLDGHARDRITFSRQPTSLSLLLGPAGGGDRGRNYATTTTTFPNFWPVSAYL